MQPYRNDGVAKAHAIRQFLDELHIGYDGARGCHMVVGPEPFRITEAEHLRLTAQGERFREWLTVTNALCARGYEDPSLHWLTNAIEGGATAEAVALHRRAYASNATPTPVLIRPDMADLGATVEVQIPGSGWGFQTALHATVGPRSGYVGPVHGLGQAIELLVGSRDVPCAYILYNEPFRREVEYFCEQCQTAGIPLELYFQRVPHSTEARFVRRPPLDDLISYVGAADLIEAHFAGELVVEPSLSLLYDQKIATAFPFDPRLRSCYRDAIRDLFPETYLIHGDIGPRFDGMEMAWGDFAKLSRAKRQFIVKYAGVKKGLRAGGKAVFNLADRSAVEVAEIIGRALEDWQERRESWMIQRRVRKKFDVSFLDPVQDRIVSNPQYALFRPLYLLPRDYPPTIVNHAALFRKEWKVHGASDTVNLPVEITR